MKQDGEATVVVVGYAASMIALGAIWWKAIIVAFAIGVVFAIGWAPKYFAKGLLALGAVASLVFLNVVPSPAKWPEAVIALKAPPK